VTNTPLLRPASGRHDKDCINQPTAFSVWGKAVLLNVYRYIEIVVIYFNQILILYGLLPMLIFTGSSLIKKGVNAICYHYPPPEVGI